MGKELQRFNFLCKRIETLKKIYESDDTRPVSKTLVYINIQRCMDEIKDILPYITDIKVIN